MVSEGIITQREALLRFEPEKINFFEQNCMLDGIAAEEAGSRCIFSAAPVVGNMGTATAVGIGVATGKFIFLIPNHKNINSA